MLLVQTSARIEESVINMVSVIALTDIQVVIVPKDFALLVQLGRTCLQEQMRLTLKWSAPTEGSVIESPGSAYVWTVSRAPLVSA